MVRPQRDGTEGHVNSPQSNDYVAGEIERSGNRSIIETDEKYKESYFAVENLYKKYSVKNLYDRQSHFITGFLKTRNIDTLLELGCGTGGFLLNARKEYPRVIGVDPAPESLEIARQLVPDADLRQGQGENLPIANEEVDAVVMQGVVHHIKYPVAVFREVARSLKPGGVLVIFEGNKSSPYRRFILRIADTLRVDHESTAFEHRAPEVMNQMLRDAGLEPFALMYISGIFVPLALSGIGGAIIWKVLDGIENVFQAIAPGLFSYHVLLAARKSDGV